MCHNLRRSQDWDAAGADAPIALLKRRFVTGGVRGGDVDDGNGGSGSGSDDDDEVYDDFEDLETGEQFGPSAHPPSLRRRGDGDNDDDDDGSGGGFDSDVGDDDSDDPNDAVLDEVEAARRTNAARKAGAKEQFDSAYDDDKTHGGGGDDDVPEDGDGTPKYGNAPLDEEEAKFLEAARARAEAKRARNAAALGGVDDAERIRLEGFRQVGEGWRSNRAAVRRLTWRVAR